MNRIRNTIRGQLRLSAATMLYAHDMMGVTEDYLDGHWTNWGPEVKEFLYAAGLSDPAPWCAAFVNWCAEQGAYDVGVESPLEQVETQAYVQSYVDWAHENLKFVHETKTGHGDLFVLYYPSLNRYAHIGFVSEMNTEEGWFTTIEGNTNDEASREGFKVASRRRVISERTKFIRWSEL